MEPEAVGRNLMAHHRYSGWFCVFLIVLVLAAGAKTWWDKR